MAIELRRPDGALSPPVFGRPSAAAGRAGRLRPAAEAGDAAYRADGGDAPTLSIRAASLAGVRHRLAGERSDDAYAWRWIATPPAGLSAAPAGLSAAPAGLPDPSAGGVVVAVADGVGTVAGSALAAAAAVSAACEAVAGLLAERTPGQADVAWWESALRHAVRAVDEVGGATTLVVAVVDAAGIGAVARVGDSTALTLTDGEWHDLWPVSPNDGTLSTLTAALPTTATPEVAGVSLEPGSVLVLLTDGVANPLRDGPTTVAPALASALADPPTPLELAVLADFSRQGCFDDRTVLGVWLRPPTDVPSPLDAVGV